MGHNNPFSRCRETRDGESNHENIEQVGGIATDVLVSIIAKNFSPGEMLELAEKVRVAAVRRGKAGGGA